MGDERSATTFGEELRRLRLRARLTLESLADASGVSARTIGGLERGHSLGPQHRTVMSLADGLGLDETAREALERLAEQGRQRPVTAPTGWCVPPRPIPDFTGRETELARLADLADGSDATASVVVLSGPGGIGKTTLAVEAGRRLARARGLSLYYVDLRGMDSQALDPSTALFRLLKALGVGNRDLPDDLEGRSGQFRTLLEERPAVVVLDNVRDEEQARPLLPGAGAGMVLVTSRRLLTGLEGVARLPVPVLDSAAAVALLASIIGDADGPRAEGLAELAAQCGGLPLALRIIGNRLATRPAWTARQLADRLADSERRLERINAGDLQITAAFGMSYDQLSPDARRLCRRLALIPGPDFTAPLASVVIGSSVPDTEDLLDELLELVLLTQGDDSRYAFHDLIRLFAADRLVAEEAPAERAALVRLMTDWLLDVAVAAGRWYEPGYGAAPVNWSLPVDLSTSELAAAWLHDEAENWFGAVRVAADHGWNQRVVDTAEAQHWFSDHWPQWPHWHELFALAAEAAEQMGDAVAQATQLNYLSWAQGVRWEQQLSAQTALRAARIAEQAGDVRQQAWGLQYAASALVAQDPAASLSYVRQAERLFVRLGDWEGHLQSLHMMAVNLISMKRPREAITVLHRSEQVARIPQPDPARQRIADVCLVVGTKYLAMAHEELGEDGLAEESYRRVLAHADLADLAGQQADLEQRFARLLYRLGRPDEAVPMLQTARSRFSGLDAADRIAAIDEVLEQWRADM
ncbi:transcriptional regulator with XRE-family HTH domain/tetratricopeptide (TPR) repeat protein [Catenulispora sp. MAP12-49]|uniref:NB-ARC domain-containing protein n=1 Tax=Catenulispora sp. MAP12-49 TaxID=3156302 RepID=UPI0035145BB9